MTSDHWLYFALGFGAAWVLFSLLAGMFLFHGIRAQMRKANWGGSGH